MYDEYSDDLGGNGHQAEQSGSGLRKQLEEVLAANKKLTERLDRLEKQPSTTALLESKGIDPAVAQIIPEDADPSEWLDKFGHLVGAKLDADVKVKPTPEENAEPDPALLEEQAAWEAANGIAQTSGTTTQIADPLAKIESFTSKEEMLAFLASQSEGRD
jgi:hypothetical protein